VSVDGLWQQKAAEPHRMAAQALPAATAPQKRSRAWRKRVGWVALGTVAWFLARLGVREVFGDGATLLEYVLLVLILGSIIGLTSRSDL